MVYTSIITITELVTSFTWKSGRLPVADAVEKVYRLSRVIPIDRQAATRAGSYSKKEFPGGIADRIILATAETRGLTIVTGDQHFKGRLGVVYIGK
jgi:predicted nucleic acid-binding protein